MSKCECKLGDICEHHGTAIFHGVVCPEDEDSVSLIHRYRDREV